MSERPDMMVHGPPPVFSMNTSTEITLSWLDRIRVLFGRTIRVEIFTKISGLEVHEHGPVTSVGHTYVDPIFPRKPQDMGIGSEAVQPKEVS